MMGQLWHFLDDNWGGHPGLGQGIMEDYNKLFETRGRERYNQLEQWCHRIAAYMATVSKFGSHFYNAFLPDSDWDFVFNLAPRVDEDGFKRLLYDQMCEEPEFEPSKGPPQHHWDSVREIIWLVF